MFYFSLALLTAVFGALIIWRPFLVKYLKLIIFSAIAVIFAWFGFLSVKQYQVWHNNDLTRHFLPPYQDYNYFLFYVFFRFFLPFLISLIIAGLFYWLLIMANKKSGERFFKKEEPALAFLAIFLSGHPGWIVYFILLFLAYFFWHLFLRLKGQKEVRLPLYYLWIPTSIIVILIEAFWLYDLSFWQKLGV